MYTVLFSTHQRKHASGIVTIARFTKYLPVAFCHRIAAQDDGGLMAYGDVSGFLLCQPHDEFWWRFSTANSALCPAGWRVDREVIAKICQQLFSPRRGTGKDKRSFAG